MVEASRKISYAWTPYPTYPVPRKQETSLETLTHRLVSSALVTDRLKVDSKGTITLPPWSIQLRSFDPNTQQAVALVDRNSALNSFRYGFAEQAFEANRDEVRALRNVFTGYLNQGQVLLAPINGRDTAQRVGSIYLFGHSPTQGQTACGLYMQIDNRESLLGLTISRPGQMVEWPLPKVAFTEDTTIIVGSTLANGLPTSQPIAIQENIQVNLGGQTKKLTFVAIPGLEPGALALKRMSDGSLAIEQLAPYFEPGRSTFIATVQDTPAIATNVGVNYPLRNGKGFPTPSGGTA